MEASSSRKGNRVKLRWVLVSKFKYEAYTGSGKKIKEYLSSPSKKSAIAELEKEGLFVTHIAPARTLAISARRISSKSLAQFNKELIALLRSGMPLIEALAMCGERPHEEYFTDTLAGVSARIAEGDSYSQACARYANAFDPLYLASIQIGERSGNMLAALTQYQNYLDRHIATVSEIKSALYYPAFMLVALVLVVSVLFLFVVPSFSELYISFDAELPFVTQVVMSAAAYVPWLLLLLGLSIVAGAGWWHIIDKPLPLRLKMDAFMTGIPMLGPIRKEAQQGRVMMMLGALLESGMPLVSSLSTLADAFWGTLIGSSIEKITVDVKNGSPFSDAVARHNLLDSKMNRMIISGERSGAMAEMAKQVAIYLEEKIGEKLKAATALFEPVMMVFLGVLVGVVIVSMYLPIFFMAEVVQ